MSPLAFTEDHLLPPSTEKLRLLKLWMRIQNRFFFFPPNDDLILLLQASAPSTTEKTALSTSQTCHLGVEWRTATTTNRRWCHSFKKESVKSGMREGRGRGGGGCWKAEDTQEKWEGGVGDVRFWSGGSSSKGFVWNLWRSSGRWGPKTLRSHTNYTPHRTVRLSHDVITFWTRLFWGFFGFFPAASHRILPSQIILIGAPDVSSSAPAKGA